MSGPLPRKWRPPLALIVFVVLTTVMALPLVGLFFFRLYENQLVRRTEAELIAQSAVVAAVFAQELGSRPELPALLGAQVPPEARPVPSLHQPIEPTLDLAGDNILGSRPEPRLPAAPADPALVDVGARLIPVLARTQMTTLAGFAVLDASGTIVASREDVGLSLAHVPEVQAALKGRYGALLRTRVPDRPPPPLYSISRGTGIRVFVAMPVVLQDRVAGVVYASRTPSNIIKHVYGERRNLALAGLTVIGATLTIGFLFWRTITRPIHDLVQRAAEVGHGRTEFVPLTHHGTREIALLSQSFVDLTARLKERSDYVETFAAHVSHEMKTPLTSIRGAAELLREGDDAAAVMPPAQRDHFICNIIADTNRLTVMLHRLRELARAENTEVKGTALLIPALDALRSEFPSLELAVSGEVNCRIGISPENLLIVLSHLADNAARHGAMRFELAALRERGAIKLILQDDGSGISEPNRDRIFDAFFTTRREAGGTGMGLGIVRAILRVHGGTIKLVPSQSGAAFELCLPLG